VAVREQADHQPGQHFPLANDGLIDFRVQSVNQFCLSGNLIADVVDVDTHRFLLGDCSLQELLLFSWRIRMQCIRD
jgi:hypothetical protein